MALYDDIADALPLTQDGTVHTVSLDNTGATCQTNEGTYGECQYGTAHETVWVSIDLSDYPGGSDNDVDFTLVRTGGGAAFAPEFGIYKVIDASFDPSAPDFSKLSVVTYVGDGSTTPPPQTVTFKGGPGSITGVASITGVFYLAFNDWNYAEYGSADVSVSIPALLYCLDAVDLINPDSDTATVVSGRVQENWDKWWDYGATQYTQVQKTLKWIWAGGSGQFRVSARAQTATTTSGSTFVTILVIVNGRLFIQSLGESGFTANTEKSWYLHNQYLASGDPYEYAPTAYGFAPWVVLKNGDLVEVMVVSDLQDGSFAFIPLQLTSLCFQVDVGAPVTTYCTPSVQFDVKPVGDEWGSPNSWGGQWQVPDQIWVELGITPYDESEFAWGINLTDYDMVALENGTVYTIVHDAGLTQGGTPVKPTADRHYIVVKKYDPSSQTWSQIATLNIRDPVDQYSAEAVSCETDGTYVYFAHWELDTYVNASPPSYLWKWHLHRLDPSDDSIIELGTGQNARTITNSKENLPPNGVCSTILAPGEGKLYVANNEVLDVTPGASPGSNDMRTQVWSWNGSSWTDISPPDPSLTNAGAYYTEGQNQYWDQLQQMVAATKDGQVTDGFTLVHAYFYFDVPSSTGRRAFRTIRYTDGSGWSDEVISNFAQIEHDAALQGERQNATYVSWASLIPISPTLLWSAKLQKLVLVLDMLRISGGEEIWDMFAMKADGSDWELLEPLGPPPSTANRWRQTRSSAAIGPDGNIYRAHMGDAIGLEFQPHITKHSPGYYVAYADACRRHIGEGVSVDAQSQTWEGVNLAMHTTANYRIRWVGNNMYVMVCLFDEALNGETMPEWPVANGIFVMKASYLPCFYRGDITFP